MDNNINQNKSNLSFWQLISQCEIKIPQLQRDYAQGREDETITQISARLISNKSSYRFKNEVIEQVRLALAQQVRESK